MNNDDDVLSLDDFLVDVAGRPARDRWARTVLHDHAMFGLPIARTRTEWARQLAAFEASPGYVQERLHPKLP